MIVGIGTDLIEIERIADALQRRGQRFAKRILGEEEFVEYQRRYAKNINHSLSYLAKRFAAKEAFAKALGTGITATTSWHSAQILNDAQGRPDFVFDAPMQQYLKQQGWQVQVSLSDEKKYAQAFVVIEHDCPK